MDIRAEVKTLKGKDAVALWLKGKEEWNKWAEENPVCNVDFSGVDFSYYVNFKPGLMKLYEWGFLYDLKNTFLIYSVPKGISFLGFKFPLLGRAIFNGVLFCNSDVFFSDVEFGRGGVDFSGLNFGNGRIAFHNSIFNGGVVYFSGAVFGGKGVTFLNTSFLDVKVIFSGAEFNGPLSFLKVFFGSRGVYFIDSIFHGDCLFERVLFNCHESDFSNAIFEKRFFLSNSTVTGGFFMRNSFFREGVYLSGNSLISCDEVNFENTVFESFFNIKGLLSFTPIDLRNSCLKGTLEFYDIDIGFVRSSDTYIFSKAKDPEDSGRFRRLRKLANDADDHARALEFFVQEMKADYWHGITGGKLALFYLYDWVSDYGRSVSRPAGLLCFVWLFFMLLYWHSRTVLEGSAAHAALLSFGHLAPIYATSKGARDNAINALYQSAKLVPEWVQAMMICQGIVSSLLLFLIALALRNRFRQ